MWTATRTLSQSVQKWRKIYLSPFKVPRWGLSSKCHHRHVSFPSRNCTSLFSGVVLLSLFIAGLQYSRLIRVECTFSTIPSFDKLPGECISAAFTFRYIKVNAGTSPFLLLIFIFSCGFWYFSYNRLSILWFVAW